MSFHALRKSLVTQKVSHSTLSDRAIPLTKPNSDQKICCRKLTKKMWKKEGEHQISRRRNLVATALKH